MFVVQYEQIVIIRMSGTERNMACGVTLIDSFRLMR